MKNIYVFGNPYLEQDNLGLEVAKWLPPQFQPKYCKSPDDLLQATESELVILDVVRNIDKPILISKIEDLKTRKLTSLHDFDVGFFLHLMQQTGLAKHIKIIGVPQKGNAKQLAKEVVLWM